MPSGRAAVQSTNNNAVCSLFTVNALQDLSTLKLYCYIYLFNCSVFVTLSSFECFWAHSVVPSVTRCRCRRRRRRLDIDAQAAYNATVATPGEW